MALIATGENLGFTGGVNAGIGHLLTGAAASEYVWLLNPDAVATPETLAHLLEAAVESGAGIVSTGPWNTGPRFWPRYFYLTPRTWMQRPPPGARWFEAALYSGACALFRTELVLALIARDGHFMDAGLFLDFDELECSLRARSLGSRIVVARHAVLVHDDSNRIFGRTRMAAARQYYRSRNMLHIARRHLPLWQFVAMLPVRIARDASWFLRLRLGGQRPNERAYVLGLIDGLRGVRGRWKEHPPAPDELPRTSAG